MASFVRSKIRNASLMGMNIHFVVLETIFKQELWKSNSSSSIFFCLCVWCVCMCLVQETCLRMYERERVCVCVNKDEICTPFLPVLLTPLWTRRSQLPACVVDVGTGWGLRFYKAGLPIFLLFFLTYSPPSATPSWGMPETLNLNSSFLPVNGSSYLLHIYALFPLLSLSLFLSWSSLYKWQSFFSMISYCREGDRKSWRHGPKGCWRSR